MSILDDIFMHKRIEIEQRRAVIPLSLVEKRALQATAPLDFLAAIRRRSGAAGKRAYPALIAEVKHRSPSRGILSSNFDPQGLAKTYRDNGAAAISVLTDERYFGGHLEYLEAIAKMSLGVPLLRKDFLCEPYQLFEARAAGADAILLIVAALPVERLCWLHSLALELGMTPLVEVHSFDELQIALTCEPQLIGMNNRNLHDFSVSLDTSIKLRDFVPQDVAVVSESGIHSRHDIDRLNAAGVDAILVGEALVTASDIAASVRSFSGRMLKV